MQRQAATSKGLGRRIRDLQFGRLRDPRQSSKVKHRLPTMLTTLVVGVATMARSLRNVEDRSEQIAERHGEWLGIQQRIADNTYSQLLPRLDAGKLVRRLHAGVKAEKRRRNLQPTMLPFATAAIDGKNVATLHWADLCRVLGLDPEQATPSQVKWRLKEQFPNLQFCNPKQGEPYALARAHTVTLISSKASACIHQRPIEGKTNEIGAMPALLKELHAAYGASNIVEMVTTDAGNTSRKVAATIVEDFGWDYFSQIKSEHGDLYTEAERTLGRRRTKQADFGYADKQNGCSISYSVWCEELSEKGWLDWSQARQLVRVQRLAEHPTTGEKTIGNRYYVTSKSSNELQPHHALAISRGHWRCEEETHWTSDALLQEDRRQLAWSRHPNGVFAVSLLRMMALNILAVARKLSRLGEREEKPTWYQVAQHFLLALAATTLITEAFDDVD